MTKTVRLGAVSYLNTKPLVYGIREGSGLSVRFDVPSACARLLAAGEIDLGLVPSITYLDRPGDRVVPGISIASDGPVASVALYHRKPLREIRTLALDTSSRTSVVLTKILCARRFEIAPVFAPAGPDLDAMLSAHDAALLIGDPALFIDHRALGAQKIDLGEAWTTMTGLPFVWAFWAGRADAADAHVVRALQHAKAEGIAASDAIADAYCAGHLDQQRVARHYLREHIKYDLTSGMIDGLTTYYREAAALGLVPPATPISFY